jgi:hypothetical protein
MLTSEVEQANHKISLLEQTVATLISMMQGNNSSPHQQQPDANNNNNNREIEELKQENQSLKAAITQRTTQANDTIVRLSQRN